MAEKSKTAKYYASNPEARKKFREAYGSVYDAKSKKWIDTNIVHDTLEVYEKATNELNEWGYIS